MARSLVKANGPILEYNILHIGCKFLPDTNGLAYSEGSSVMAKIAL
jgi:hypothetical protein